jgi:HEAT repeat protein
MFSILEQSPVLVESSVREHIANATQLLELLRNPSRLPANGVAFQTWCQRCEANLDGLRVAGAKALRLGKATMDVDHEVASVVALLMAEAEGDQPDTTPDAVSLLRHESPEVRQAAWWGLRLASSRHVEPHLRALLGKPKWDFASAAALDILTFHRLPVQAELGAPPDEEGDENAWLLAEAGGRMRGAWNATHLKQFLGHASPRVRESALRASARCGLPELPASCREATSQLEPAEAIEFLGVVGSPEDLSRLQGIVQSAVAAARTERGSPEPQHIATPGASGTSTPSLSLQPAAGLETRAPAVAKAALNGLGRLGLPSAVPFLLDLMESPELAEPAAAAIWRITGQEVPRGPAPEPPPGLTEDELDLWEPQPPVDAPRARDWWKANAARFDPAKRYQTGLNVTDAPLGPVFDQLPLAIRYDIYLRERALTPGTPDWEHWHPIGSKKPA